MTASTSSRGTSLQHQLGKDSSIPKQIPEERLGYLTARIRAGSITVEERDELAKSFIRLALKIASTYAARKPSSGDEFASAALFGIVYALNKAQEKLKDDNITGWVISCIRSHIQRCFETDHVVRIPSSTFHKAKAEGKPITAITVSSFSVTQNNYARMRSDTVYDLREVLQLSARDDVDRTILKMRADGYKDAEIAQHLKISTAYVQRKRSEMEIRFDKLSSGG